MEPRLRKRAGPELRLRHDGDEERGRKKRGNVGMGAEARQGEGDCAEQHRACNSRDHGKACASPQRAERQSRFAARDVFRPEAQDRVLLLVAAMPMPVARLMPMAYQP